MVIKNNKRKLTYIMIKKNSTYLTPECTLIDIRLEGVLCASQDNGIDGFIIDDYEKLPGSWS